MDETMIKNKLNCCMFQLRTGIVKGTLSQREKEKLSDQATRYKLLLVGLQMQDKLNADSLARVLEDIEEKTIDKVSL